MVCQDVMICSLIDNFNIQEKSVASILTGRILIILQSVITYISDYMASHA